MSARASLSLNGVWRMAPDPRGDGASRGCMRPYCDDGRWREAPSPSVFEHDCPELDFYRGQCWYRRRVTLPADWRGRRVALHFGGINDRASVWLNGVKLGDSPDGFLPIEFPLGDAAVYGGEVVVDHVQISAANLAAGSYAVWMGMYSPTTQVRATIEAETVVVSENRARLLEFQIGP